MLQNPAAGQAEDHKSYHSDDPSYRYHNVDVTKPVVSDASKDIQVLVANLHVISAFHPSGLHHSQDI